MRVVIALEGANMSRKHFIALADALKLEKPQPGWDPNKMVQWELDVKAIAGVCAESNPRFDYQRWMEYIGVQP
jgi:hypothetical protein